MIVTDRGVVAFELERFVAVGTRLEVTGRWHSVRGRRFMRPTLTIEVDGGEVRALALLEHKPWAPDEEVAWTAAFEWSGPLQGVDQFELAVAPDIAVHLPAPARKDSGAPSHEDDPNRVVKAVALADDAKPRDVEGRQEAQSQRRREQASVELKAAFAARNKAIEERDFAVAESDRLAAECERLMDEHGQLVGRSYLVKAERDTAVDELAAAVRERDHALSELAATIQERENAVTELAEAIPTRDRMLGDLAAAVEERDRAFSQVTAAVHERDRAVSEVTAAVEERDRAFSEVTAAVHERDRALSEMAAALQERDRAIARHERAASELRDLRQDLARVRCEHSAKTPAPVPAAPATTSAPVGPARVVRPQAAGERWRVRSEHGRLATRLFALAALITLLVVLLLIITSK